MPDLLSALITFVAEHRRCGELASGLEGGMVRLSCTCSARLIRRPAAEHRGQSAGTDSARRADFGPAET